MFSLSVPLTLPADRSFFSDGHPLPMILGRYQLSCSQTRASFAASDENYPLLLKLEGFETREEAEIFLPTFIETLRWASIELGYSLSPSTDTLVYTTKSYDGRVPAVFETSLGCLEYFTKASAVGSEHVSKISKAVEAAFAFQVPVRFASEPELKLAFELYSEVEFVGGTNAKFIVLISALEVLVSAKEKRGAVIGLAKKTLTADGQTDGKAVGNTLDDLYKLRNALLHEAKAVKPGDLKRLQVIVGRVLKAKITAKGNP